MRSQFNLLKCFNIFVFFGLIGLLSACGPVVEFQWDLPVPTPEPPPTIAVTRALWVHDQNVIVSENEREKLFTFAAAKKINTLFIFAFSLIRDNPEALRQFIVQAGEQGFRVEFIAGVPEWAWEANHYIPLSFLRDSFEFSKSLPDNHRLTGIVFDLEPYVIEPNDWPVPEYLNLLRKLIETTQGTNMTITVAMPFWFDINDLRQSYQGQEKYLSHLVIDMADRVLIMDYRDFAEGDDGMISSAENEMAYAAATGKPVIIGVETECDQPDPPKVTFCEEGEAILNKELTKVEASFGKSPSWGGIAIKNYTSYSQIIPFACPEDHSFKIVDPPPGFRTTDRLITVRGCGGISGKNVRLYVNTEMPFLQDHSPTPGPDGRWVVENVSLGALTLPYTHTIFALTERDGQELRSNEIDVIKE